MGLCTIILDVLTTICHTASQICLGFFCNLFSLSFNWSSTKSFNLRIVSQGAALSGVNSKYKQNPTTEALFAFVKKNVALMHWGANRLLMLKYNSILIYNLTNTNRKWHERKTLTSLFACDMSRVRIPSVAFH